MTSLIQKVISLTFKTFSRLSSHKLAPEDIHPLSSLVSQIRAKDISFDENLVSLSYRGTDLSSPPSTYIDILDNKYVTIGVFVLRKDTGIPLHNHPGMYGICKVIHGKMSVTSYSIVPNESEIDPPDMKLFNPELHNIPRQMLRPVLHKESTILTPEDGCCVLTPEDGNIHEICPVDGPAAFFDILFPPYDHETGARICQYYKKLDKLLVNNGDSYEWLVEMPQPNNFWCDTATYRGPTIDLF